MLARLTSNEAPIKLETWGSPTAVLGSAGVGTAVGAGVGAGEGAGVGVGVDASRVVRVASVPPIQTCINCADLLLLFGQSVSESGPP